ncbi:MAG TPA: class I tRNA ligase family protein, partial [Methylomirabilota bacterium]|nr:class I tRNA ligase family protein [Methylomirabilota bacterium]
LEIAKHSLYQREDPLARAVTQKTLVETLEATLRLLHPFMPFITEEIWQRLPHQGESIMTAPYPKVLPKARDRQAEWQMAPVLDFVSAQRTIRSESRIPPSVTVKAVIRPLTERVARATERDAAIIGRLAKAEVTIIRGGSLPSRAAIVATPSGDVAVPLDGLVDFEAEKQRLRKEIERAEKEIAFLEAKLGRRAFVERAPADVVERERQRLAEQRRIREKLSASLTALA